MELIFVQRIYKMTELLLQGELSPEKALAELASHLHKAQTLQLPDYEAEVLNTFAIAHYLLNDFAQALLWWEKMLVLAQKLGNEKLITKVCGNLAELMLNQYQYAQALNYVQVGLALVHAGYQNKLGALNLYSLASNSYLALGNFTEAEAHASVFWSTANNIDLEGYSRFEYAQMIVMMHTTSAYLALIAKDNARFEKHSHLAADLAQQFPQAPYTTSTMALQSLLHAILIEGNLALALEWENKLSTLQAGQIQIPELCKLSEILFYTGQVSQAQKYASQILNQSDALAALKEFAQMVMDAKL